MKKKKNILLIAIVIVGIIVTACNNSFKDTNPDGYDYLVLVNKYSKLPDDWEKKVELVDAKNAWDEDIKIEKKTYEQYQKLAKALKEDGINIELDSVYRSVKEQQALWDDWSKDPEKGIEYVKKYVAVPGYSEHHTGLAVDICLKKKGKIISDNDEMIAEKEIFAKIHQKLADYGFILRYLKNRDDTTGYAYEPWHLRYVYSTEIAKEIMDKNITFEEYLGSIKNIKKVPSAAKYQIERTLEEYLTKNVYKNKISNIKFNITKIYTEKEVKENETLKSSNIGAKDIAFEVIYEMIPADDVDPNELMIPDGNYNKESGYVTDVHRVGILKYNDKKGIYSITDFGTGF